MARYTGPKNKLSRREGEDLFGKGVKLRRLTVPPGVHGPRVRAKKLSDYGAQLREKQKVKRVYGIMERQFRRYVEMAERSNVSTGTALIQILENRLDNILYRSGIAATRNMARQFIVHGHVKVDGIKVDRPSYQVKAKQTITLSDKIVRNPDVVKLMEADEVTVPAWLLKKSAVIQKVSDPVTEDLGIEINLPLIVEYYSR